VGWSLVVHLYLLAELLQEDLFGMDCLLSEGLFLCLFLVDSLLGWLHLEVVLLMRWLLVVHLAELLQDDLFSMDCLLLEVFFSCLFLVEELLGWLHLEVVLLMGWLLVVHLAELLQEDLFGMDCLLYTYKVSDEYIKKQSHLINTVKENRVAGYTQRQFEQAKRARELYHIVGTPTIESFKALIKMNAIKVL
jgi:hypothetical protein